LGLCLFRFRQPPNSSKLTARNPGSTGKKRAILPRGWPQRVSTAGDTSCIAFLGERGYRLIRTLRQQQCKARGCHHRPSRERGTLAVPFSFFKQYVDGECVHRDKLKALGENPNSTPEATPRPRAGNGGQAASGGALHMRNYSNRRNMYL
jgi:hypothetical protein